MPTSSEKKLKVFYCYARKDQVLREELEQHLSNLKRLYHLETWFDREISPGQIWHEAIDEHLKSADLIFLLVSPDFMASDYCYNKEMQYALTRHRNGEAKVLPILLRPVHWKDAPFSHIQVLPKDAQPVTLWPNRDDAFYDVALGLELVIRDLLSLPKTVSQTSQPASQPHETPIAPEPLSPVKHGLSRRTVVGGLAGLTAVGVAGGGFFWLTHSQTSGSSMSVPPPTQTAIAQAKNDFEKNAAANGMMFGFDASNTRNNPYEILLNTDNVAGLKLYWEAATKGRVSTSPIVVNGVVYVGCEDSYLYAFDATSGSKLWSAQMGGKVSSPAVASNRIVYVGCDDANLYAFDTTTGGTSRKPLWTAKTGGALTSPTVANGIVYISSFTEGDNNVYAFNANAGGPPLWTAHTGGAIFRPPAVFKGVVYVGSRDGNVYAFNALTGKQLWTFPTGAGIDAAPAVAPNGIVYVGSRDGYMYAIDASTGEKQWGIFVDGYFLTSSAAVANEWVFVGSWSGYLYAFDGTNGYVMWKALTSPHSDGNNGIEASPTVANGVGYVASDDGNVYAFNANTGGPPLWKAFVSAFYTCPTVANGVAYIGAEFKNALYAFHLP